MGKHGLRDGEMRWYRPGNQECERTREAQVDPREGRRSEGLALMGRLLAIKKNSWAS